ncbi:MAG: FUSC family protein, partial [Microcystaceae cyanobacterium]
MVKTLQDNLTDLHDPAGVHWHRAVNATIAGGIAALLLFWNPVLVQPLAVISALIFSHTNKGSQLAQQKRSQGIALGISLISIALLTLFHSLALAQGIIITLLSFLAEYATKWGAEYGFKFVLILALVATREEDLSGNIPLVVFNLGIGFGLAYGLGCQCFPYRFQRAERILSQRIDRRLAELLAKITMGQNTNSLKRRLFSLLQTEADSFTQFSMGQTEDALQTFSTQMSLFEALVILERSLILVSERPDFQYLNQIIAVKNPKEIPSLLPAINTTIEVQQAVQALVTILSEKSSSRSLFLPPKPQKIPPQFWDFNDAIAHQAFRSAIAVALALMIADGFHLPHSDWIVISALIVSQEAVGDTLRKSYGRIWGSVLGLMVTLVLVAIAFQYHSVVLVLAFLTIFPYLYLRPSLNHYGYAKFFQQIAVICFLVLIGERANLELIEWRIGNIILGCVIGQGVSLFV